MERAKFEMRKQNNQHNPANCKIKMAWTGRMVRLTDDPKNSQVTTAYLKTGWTTQKIDQ